MSDLWEGFKSMLPDTDSSDSTTGQLVRKGVNTLGGIGIWAADKLGADNVVKQATRGQQKLQKISDEYDTKNPMLSQVASGVKSIVEMPSRALQETINNPVKSAEALASAPTSNTLKYVGAYERGLGDAYSLIGADGLSLAANNAADKLASMKDNIAADAKNKDTENVLNLGEMTTDPMNAMPVFRAANYGSKLGNSILGGAAGYTGSYIDNYASGKPQNTDQNIASGLTTSLVSLAVSMATGGKVSSVKPTQEAKIAKDIYLGNNELLASPELSTIKKDTLSSFKTALDNHVDRTADEQNTNTSIASQMSQNGAQPKDILQTLNQNTVVTPEDIQITSLINNKQDVSPIMSGFRSFDALGRYIKDGQMSPDEIYSVYKEHGFTDDTADVFKEAYAAKDPNLALGYFISKYGDEMRKNSIADGYKNADSLVDARAAALGMDRKTFDETYPLHTSHEKDASKIDIDNEANALFQVSKDAPYEEKLSDIRATLKGVDRNKLKDDEKSLYDFALSSKNFVEYIKDGVRNVLNKGDDKSGFKHIIIRHYGAAADGELSHWDILRLAKTIKEGTPLSDAEISYIKSKAAEKGEPDPIGDKTVLRRYAQDGSIYYAVLGKDKRNGDNVVVTYYRVRQVKDDSPKSPIEYSSNTADGYSGLNAPDAEILSQYKIESQDTINGMYQKLGATHIIQTFKTADMGTVFHEYGHYFRQTLTPEELRTAEELFGVKDGVWDREHEESFARSFVKWLSDAKAPTPTLDNIFVKVRVFLQELFGRTKPEEAFEYLTPEQKDFFGALFGDKDAAKKIYDELNNKNIDTGYMELYQYAGAKAKGFDDAAARGEVFENPFDKQPRFEIDDSKATITARDGILADVLHHPELFANYPALASVPVHFVDMKANARFHNGAIEIASHLTPEQKKSELIHEIQHAIQEIEGHAVGGSPFEFMSGRYSTDPFGAYKRLAGEIEARDAAARSEMDAEQRASTPPLSSEHIDVNDAIVKIQDSSKNMSALSVPMADRSTSFFTKKENIAVRAFDRAVNAAKGIDENGNAVKNGFFSKGSKAEWQFGESTVNFIRDNFVIGGNKAHDYLQLLNDFNQYKAFLRSEAESLYNDLKKIKNEDGINILRALDGDADAHSLTGDNATLYKQLRETLDANTNALIQEGLLSEIVRKEHYVKRFYRDHIDGGLFAGIGSKKLSGKHARTDMDLETRIQKGQIDDLAYVVTKTMLDQKTQLMQAKFLRNVADKIARDTETDGYVKVPDININDSGSHIRPFGALGGKYVPESVYKDIKGAYDMRSGIGFLERYIYPAVAAIKVNVTVKNPATHVYNVVSNMYISYLHGSWDYVGGLMALRLKDKATFDALVKEANRYGLSSQMKDMEGDVLSSLQKIGAAATLLSYAKNALAMKGTKVGEGIRTAYDWEDKIFRLAAYEMEKDVIRKSIYQKKYSGFTGYVGRDKYNRIELTDAQRKAAWDNVDKIYVNYNTPTPKAIELVDKTGLAPFLTYSWRSTPQIIRLQLQHPFKTVASHIALSTIGGSAIMAMILGQSDENILPEYMNDSWNIIGFKNYVPLGDGRYLNLARMTPGLRFMQGSPMLAGIDGGFLLSALGIGFDGIDPAKRYPIDKDSDPTILKIAKRASKLSEYIAPSWIASPVSIKDKRDQYGRKEIDKDTGEPIKDTIAIGGGLAQRIIAATIGSKKDRYGNPNEAVDVLLSSLGIRRVDEVQEAQRRVDAAMKKLKIDINKADGDYEAIQSARDKYEKSIEGIKLDVGEDGEMRLNFSGRRRKKQH